MELLLITDAALLEDHSALATLTELMAAGLDRLQVREPAWSDRRIVEFTRALVRGRGALPCRILVNDRFDLALAAGADGVHLKASGLPTATVRRETPAGFLIGRSTHQIPEVEGAAAAGADYVTFGPVYATPSKAAYGPPQGVTALRAACAAAGIPVFAVGGIGPARLPALGSVPIAGVALIRGILAAPDPPARVRELKAALAEFS